MPSSPFRKPHPSRFGGRYLEAPATFTGAWLGVDLGLVHLAVDSDGDCYPSDPDRAALWERLRREVLRDGLLPDAQKEAFLSLCVKLSRLIARKAHSRGAAVATEKLPAAGLDPLMRLVRLRFTQALMTATLERGVPMRFVSPRNNSLTCPLCRHAAAANRPSQARFVCRACDFEAPADQVGALNAALRARGC